MIATALRKLINELSCLIYWLKNTKKMRTTVAIAAVKLNLAVCSSQSI